VNLKQTFEAVCLCWCLDYTECQAASSRTSHREGPSAKHTQPV